MSKKINNKNKNSNFSKQIKKILQEEKATGLIDNVFIYTKQLEVKTFAEQIGKNTNDILKYFFNKGVLLTQNTFLNEEQMGELALEFGFDFKKEIKVTKENIFESLQLDENEKEDNLEQRPPIVTIMGHVDHGKTTLLDAIKNSSLTELEVGGITQAIGAYQIKTKDNKKITFIDTPGHEAFTQMRSRGANITDIVVLIVAADDGVMPQTIEAIDHAKLSKAPIIVFINKIDKPGADVERIKAELMKYDLIAEEYGGDIPFVTGSAKQKINLDKLEDTILLLAEINEFKANPNKLATGVVLEAHLDKNKGPVASIIVQNGTLEMKDILVVGTTFGTIKHMEDEHNKKVLKADPSKPVLIYGLNETPNAGDKFMVINDEKMARTISEAQKLKALNSENQNQQNFSLETIKQHIDDGELKTINIILKADTQGSAEAIKGSIYKIDIEGVKINVIRSAVGVITINDVTLASTVKDGLTIIYGFNIRPDAVVRKSAEEQNIDIRFHNIIYKLTEELELAAKGILDPEYKEVILGHAEVRNLFRHSDIGTIAGFHVIDGSIPKSAKVNLIRDGVVVYTGEISSLKHLKNDIKEAKINSEGGLTIKNFNDIKENDVIEAFKMELIEK